MIASGTPPAGPLTLVDKARQAPPPPRPAREGRVTARVRPTATAASAALPPEDSTSRPASTARGSSAVTPPRKPAT